MTAAMVPPAGAARSIEMPPNDPVRTRPAKPVPPSAEAVAAAAMPPGLLADYIAHFAERGDPRQIDATILRTRSIEGRDLLAAIASSGAQRWSSIREMLVRAHDPRRRGDALEMVRSLDPRGALRLARVVALQSLLPDDRALALALYRLFMEVRGDAALQQQHQRLVADLAIQLRDWPLARHALEQFNLVELDRQMLEADLLNPFIGSPYADAGRWLDVVNRDLLARGVAPLAVHPEDGVRCPYDRVVATAPRVVEDGPLVTVVVTSWSPGPGLLTALSSVLSQSWRNLEILVIDDCSPDAHLPILEQVAALDPRVRLLRQDVNGGTYVARNRGLAEARGRYFTVHDSDDWAHPERIERQVRALMDDPSLVSTGSMAYRCDDRLVFNMLATSAARENASSLTFDLPRVRDRIGFYDASRKGADTEYALRMQRAFGPASHRLLQEPLALIRLSPGSLSREEFKPGWRHPSRTMYRRSYEAWHEEAAGREDALHMPQRAEREPFRKPARFLVDQCGPDAARRQAYDVVFVADLRGSAEHPRALVEEAAACTRAGLRTAVLHLESYRHSSRREVEPLAPPVERALRRGDFDEVLYTDTSSVGLLVVRDPVVLQFPQARPAGLRVASALVVAAHGAIGADGRIHYEPLDAAAGCYRMFDVEPRWVAEGAAAHGALVTELSPRAVSPRRWPRPALAAFREVPRNVVGSAAPVVGHVLTDAGPFAGVAGALAAGDDALQFRFLVPGRDPLAARVLGDPPPAHWLVLDDDGIDADLFLAQCEYYFHPGSDGGRVDPWPIVEAMAAGCVPVLAPDWQPVFGDAAVYAAPSDIAAAVLRLHADPEARTARRQAAQAWVREHHGAEAFVAGMNGLSGLCCYTARLRKPVSLHPRIRNAPTRYRPTGHCRTRLRRPAVGRGLRPPHRCRRLRHQRRPHPGTANGRRSHARSVVRGTGGSDAAVLHRQPRGPAQLQRVRDHGADADRHRAPARFRSAAEVQREHRQGAEEGRHRDLRVDRLSGRHRGSLRAGA